MFLELVVTVPPTRGTNNIFSGRVCEDAPVRRNRLRLLLPWLEARVAEGNQDPARDGREGGEGEFSKSGGTLKMVGFLFVLDFFVLGGIFSFGFPRKCQPTGARRSILRSFHRGLDQPQNGKSIPMKKQLISCSSEDGSCVSWVSLCFAHVARGSLARSPSGAWDGQFAAFRQMSVDPLFSEVFSLGDSRLICRAVISRISPFLRVPADRLLRFAGPTPAQRHGKVAAS